MKKTSSCSPKVTLHPFDGDASDIQSVKRFHDSVVQERLDVANVIVFGLTAALVVLIAVAILLSM